MHKITATEVKINILRHTFLLKPEVYAKYNAEVFVMNSFT